MMSESFKSRLVLMLISGCLWVSGCASGPRGIDRFDTVEAGVLYRGAEPDALGLRDLGRRGVRTVVDLRDEDRGDEPATVDSLGMKYVHFPSRADQPDDETMAHFLAVAMCRNCRPVFVHCRQGRDRTGTAVAVYRMTVTGWDVTTALNELRRYQGGLHAMWFPQIPRYLRRLDLDALRRQALPCAACKLTVSTTDGSEPAAP